MIGGVLGMGRQMAELRMTDMCRITRTTPGAGLDEATGTRPQVTITVYEGKARFKQSGMAPKDVEAASQLLIETSPELHIPAGVRDVRGGDIVEWVSSTTAPEQTGGTYKVSAPFDGSQTTAQRLRIEAFHGR